MSVDSWVDLAGTYLPAFDKITAELVVPGMTTLLQELNAELDGLEKTVQPTWSGLVDPIERITDRLSRVWGSVTHLKVRTRGHQQIKGGEGRADRVMHASNMCHHPRCNYCSHFLFVTISMSCVLFSECLLLSRCWLVVTSEV